MLHQMTWTPQSPDLNPTKMVWDELEKFGKAFQVKLVEGMPRVCKAVIKAKGGYLEESKYLFGYYMIIYV